jgi:hypothetical protein
MLVSATKLCGVPQLGNELSHRLITDGGDGYHSGFDKYLFKGLV